jgi:bacterioferritin-associated ferredoxin
VRQVADACGAASGCGGCALAVREIVEEELKTSRHSLVVLSSQVA